MSKACLKIHLVTGEVKQKKAMAQGTDGFAECFIGNRIYIIGGMRDDMDSTSETSFYDTFRNQWCTLQP